MIPDRAVLEGLLERVRSCSPKGDRDLDRDIHAALGLPMNECVHAGVMWNLYTGSIDAAVVLVETVLPGWPSILTTMPMAQIPSRYVAKVIYVPSEEKAWGVHHEGGGANMALALCAALVTALLAQTTP